MFLRTTLTATLAAMSAVVSVSASTFSSPSDSILDARQQMGSSSNLEIRNHAPGVGGGSHHRAMMLKRQDEEEEEDEASTSTASADATADATSSTTAASSTSTSAFSLVENPPANETAWDEETEAACIAALSLLDEATNPSGNCVCYNLAALDTNTGVFQADLRMFRVSDAREEFEGIDAQDIEIGLSYSGASVSQASSDTVTRRDNGGGGGLVKRSDPELLRTWMFVGQIDEDEMAVSDMSIAEIEALVMPVVTLSGTSGSTFVSTNISMNEAAFVTGVFSDEIVLSDVALAQLEVDEQEAGLADGTVVFQVPGIRIMIFPVALIIVSFWLVLFVATVGYGTVQRIQFREQFRRRTAQMQKGAQGTI